MEVVDLPEIDLVRQIVLELEKRRMLIPNSLRIEGVRDSLIFHLLELLTDSGYVAKVHSRDGHLNHYRLTPEGYKVAASFRDESWWKANRGKLVTAAKVSGGIIGALAGIKGLFG